MLTFLMAVTEPLAPNEAEVESVLVVTEELLRAVRLRVPVELKVVALSALRELVVELRVPAKRPVAAPNAPALAARALTCADGLPPAVMLIVGDSTVALLKLIVLPLSRAESAMSTPTAAVPLTATPIELTLLVEVSSVLTDNSLAALTLAPLTLIALTPEVVKSA